MADSSYEESDNESFGSEGFNSDSASYSHSDPDSEFEEVESILKEPVEPFLREDNVIASKSQDPDLEFEEVESILEEPVEPLLREDNVIASKSQDDIGQSSTQIPDEEDTPIVIPYKGQTFDSLEEAKAFYHEYARKEGFGVHTRDSRRNRDYVITRLNLCCDREGRYVPRVKPDNPEKAMIKRNTLTQKCGCMARFRVVIHIDGRWLVNEFHEIHNHEPVTPSKQMCMRGSRHMPMAAKALVDTFCQCNLPVGKVVALLNGKTVGFDERDCHNHLGKSKAYKTPVDNTLAWISSKWINL